MPPVARQTLNTTVWEVTLSSLSPHQNRSSQFHSASDFYNSRSIMVGWLIKDGYFSTAEMPWTKPFAH